MLEGTYSMALAAGAETDAAVSEACSTTTTALAGAREKMLNTLRQLTGQSSRKPATSQSQ